MREFDVLLGYILGYPEESNFLRVISLKETAGKQEKASGRTVPLDPLVQKVSVSARAEFE